MASFKRTKADIDEFYSRLPSCTIEKVEYRGITINQLQFIYDEIEARCTVEGWKDELTMKLLTPAEVNLYHIKEKIIKAKTKKATETRNANREKREKMLEMM